MNPRILLGAVSRLARAAGEQVMRVYATDFAVQGKDDDSLLTAADHLSEGVILAGLACLTPGIHVVSEEQSSSHFVPEHRQHYWMIDPLDGTREFVSGNGEFTVNIALLQNNQPILGVVFAPAIDRMFAGVPGSLAQVEDGRGRRQIGCRAPPPQGLTVVGSRSHSDREAMRAFLGGRKIAEEIMVGSSLKFCVIAAGEADLYPRLGRTMEWDTAAGQAVLVAAGGHVRTLAGGQLEYGKVGLANPHFVASGLDG